MYGDIAPTMNKDLHPKQGVGRQRWWLILIALASAFLGLVWLVTVAAQGDGAVDGTVMGDGAYLSGARVRVRATENMTFTDETGRFLLTGLAPGEPVEVTAWYTGYYIAGRVVTPTVHNLTLTLRPLHTQDHSGYTWTSPITGTSAGACANCHPMIMPQWEHNAHGQAISNPRFFSLYDGTNLSGTTVITPGYLLDFPGTAGNCANCHAPGAGIDGYLTTPMDNVRDVITAGIHCDFCHKVGGVYLDPATGSVYPNSPGVQSERVLRPPAGDNVFFGPFDDIPDPDTYLALMDRSQFCAPCHQFSFWGTPIYESFNEWLASDYPAAGIVCQDCHMVPTGDEYFALPEVGGLPRPPDSIPSHLQPGAANIELLQNTVTMTMAAQQVGGQVQVTVIITNTDAGHHVPTDHPGRQVILIVQANDTEGHPLAQLAGPQVPNWVGDLTGLPGNAYAKVLQDVASGQSPVVSYWRPTIIVADNRIPAGDRVSSVYHFAAPETGNEVTIAATLRFRRSFYADMMARSWQTPDITMEELSTSTPIEPWWNHFFPLLMGADS